jgi:hypothetical protein
MKVSFPRERHLLSRLIPILLLCFTVGIVQADAQRKAGNTARQTAGTLRLKVPSGITGDNYWIYVNGKLVSSPPRATAGPLPVMVVHLADGSGRWEAWASDGLVTTSSRLDEYVRSGDKHGLFRDLELQVPPGTHSVEFLVPGTNTGVLFPYVGSTKDGVVIRPGSTTEVYLNIPQSWSNAFPLLAAPNAVGMSLCPNTRQFDITRASEVLLKRVSEYRDLPLRRLLLNALSNYRPGDHVVRIDFGSGPREVDGKQLEKVLSGLYGSPYTRDDVAYCRKYLPQYSEAFSEFEATIEWVQRDIRSFRKLAEDLNAARREIK